MSTSAVVHRESDSPGPPQPRRRRATRPVCFAAGAVVVMLAVWIILAGQARGAMEILPRAMHCGSRDVPFRIVERSVGAEPRPAFDVTLGPKSFCQLTVTFVNHGSRSVHLDTATFPGMAPGEAGSGPLEVTQNGGRFNQRDGGATEDGDAVLPLDVDLAPDESTEEIFDFRTRTSDFLGDPNRFLCYESLPLVHLSSAWIPGTVRGSVGMWINEKK